MTTNPIGKGSKTIGINMCKKMSEELERRASSMHISIVTKRGRQGVSLGLS